MSECYQCFGIGSYFPDWTYETPVKCFLCQCPECRGIGYIPITEGAPPETCDTCLGLGKINK